MPLQKWGLAIDWETSGYSVPNYAERHQGLSFGALIFDTADFTIVDTLYVEIKFNEKYTWDDGAQRVHGLTKEHLAQHGVTQQEAALMLAEFVLKYLGTEKIVVLGHRPGFDIAFTDQVMATVDMSFNYDPIRIDSAAFAFTMLGLTKSDELFDAMGMPERGKHNALTDIVYTLESMRGFKEIFLAGLAAS